MFIDSSICPPIHLFIHFVHPIYPQTSNLSSYTSIHSYHSIHPSSNPFIHLFIQSIHPFIHPFIHVVHSYIYPSIHSSIHLSSCPSIHPSIYHPVHSLIYPSTYTSIYPCIHVHVYLSIHRKSTKWVELVFVVYINLGSPKEKGYTTTITGKLSDLTVLKRMGFKPSLPLSLSLSRPSLPLSVSLLPPSLCLSPSLSVFLCLSLSILSKYSTVTSSSHELEGYHGIFG